MKTIAPKVGFLFLMLTAAPLAAEAASLGTVDSSVSDQGGLSTLPPVQGPLPGSFNPGGPMRPVAPPGPGHVHCDCVRLVGDVPVSCCP